MLTGKYFTLNATPFALVKVKGHPKAVTVPAGVVIQVITDLKPDYDLGNNMVEVVWKGRTVTMFALDIQDHGKIVINNSAGS